MESQNFFNLDTFVQNITSTAEFTRQSVIQKSKDNVSPNVKPGFLIDSFQPVPPKTGIPLEEIQQQIKQKMLPGILNWQSSNFFGYFPSSISDMSVCADVFSLTFNNPSFNYSVSPTHTQLQNLVVDWSTEALGLPEKFKRKNTGGGVINTSASNSLFLAVHAAKHRKLEQQKISLDDPKSVKLVGYVSETAHISSLRALMLKDIHHRKLVPCYFDNEVKNYQVDLVKFREIIEEDVKNGLIPFFYGASIGSTWSGAVDQIQDIAKICQQYGMWFNVDSAYLGTTWVCPEFRDTQKGIEHADSLTINFSKLGLIGMGGSLFFLGNKSQFQQSMNVNKQFSLYKQSEAESYGLIDYRDWKVDLGKTPMCFRFYYFYRFYGVEKIQQSFRWRNKLGQYIEKLVNQSEIFELFSHRCFGLVCFKLKGENSTELTKQLSSKISNLIEGYTTSSQFKNDFIIRMSVSSPNTTIEQIDAWWSKVNETARALLSQKCIKE